jgi:hypothetical protein
MPWGDPLWQEPMWCVACGIVAASYIERRLLGRPTRWARVCPECVLKGWKLVGEVVAGRWYGGRRAIHEVGRI